MPAKYDRIMIIGNNGSGKSHFARELAMITGLPLIHLDREYWQPGWKGPAHAEWIKKQQALVAEKKWIIDGMHAATMGIRFEAADAVIFLDMNRLVCLAGVLGRYGKRGPDMPPGMEDRLNRQYWQLIKGLWCFPKVRRPMIEQLRVQDPQKPFLVIKGRREMDQFLRRLQEQTTER